MSAANPESDVVYATTDNGLRLPVIDITQPAFALPDDPQSIAALSEAYEEAERRNARMPPLMMRFMLHWSARRSLLLAGIVGAKSGFLDGLTTYIMKLGAANLPPPFDSNLDRSVAATPHVVAVLSAAAIR